MGLVISFKPGSGAAMSVDLKRGVTPTTPPQSKYLVVV